MPDTLRGFISYSTTDRHRASTVKEHLAGLGVECFMAHDDLGVSDEWKKRIVEELQRMDVFVALFSQAFKASDWASQELGFAVARPEVAIIPLSLDDTVPYGFIGDLQSKRLVEPLSDGLFLGPLHRRYPRQVTAALIRRMAGASSYRGAEALMEPLRAFYKDFTPVEVDLFVDACISNGQIWDAALCAAEYLPEFIALHRTRIRAARLHVLEYQIRERKRYVLPDET